MSGHPREGHRSLPSVILFHAGDILRTQLEVEDLKVLLDAVLVRGLGQRHHSQLDQVPQADLGRGPSILLGQLLGVLVKEERRPLAGRLGACQGAVGADDQAMTLCVLPELVLLESGVALHLVHHRADAAVGQHALRLSGIEVGQTDAARQAQVHQFLHFAPGVQVVHIRQLQSSMHVAVVVELLAHRHVHQVEVNVLQTQVVQAKAAGALHQTRIVVDPAQLGGHEDLLASHNTLGDLLGDRLPHLSLVLVDEGGVQVPVAHVEGVARGVVGVRLEGSPGAQTQDRHLAPIIQLDGGSQIGHCVVCSCRLIINAVQIGRF